MLTYELPPLEDPAQLERAFVSFNIVRQTGTVNTVNADLWAIGITTGSTRLAEHLEANSDVALTNRADNIKAQDNIIKSGNHLSRTFSDENAAGLLAGYLRKPILAGTTPPLKTCTGTLVVDCASTQRGSFSVGGGRLQIAGGSALGASRLIPLAGGTVTLSQGLQATVGGLAALAGASPIWETGQ